MACRRPATRRKTRNGFGYLALPPDEADPDFAAAPPAAAGAVLLPLPTEADPARRDASVDTIP